MKVVVDASVAAKWFLPEIHSDAASRLLDPEITLYAPDLIVPEFGNILWKKIRRAELEREEAVEIHRAFVALPLELRPSSVLLTAAFELAVALGRSVYDSLYVVLAVAEDCAMVTADAKLYSVVAGSSVASHVRWVEDDL